MVSTTSKQFKAGLSFVQTLAKENERIAIHASLEDIYREAVACAPKLIVELGISKEALSAKVLSKVASMFDADHVGVDIYPYPGATGYEKFHFIHSNDIQFSWKFDGYCNFHKIVPRIDLLFVDTNELYPQVKAEILFWFPFLREICTVMFRCTNLQKILHYKDGSTTNRGWDNERGVIRALTEYLKEKWDETKEWQGKIGEWHVKHWPWGAGLTVMRRE